MTGLSATVEQAFTRFGLGGRPDDAVPSDPVGWLRGQLAAPDPTPVAGMPTVAQGLALTNAFDMAIPGTPARTAAAIAMGKLFAAEAQALLTNAVVSPAPFRERLVWFWANHFAIMAADNPPCLSVAGAYIRDAIRPNVTGTFSDMLLAVMAHPAMLSSLDNTTSIGPQSQQAVRALKNNRPLPNINENLGRETLELYTVGVQAGYAQADVDAMAYLLSGWTINTTTSPRGFYYNPAVAQPGSQTVMGATFPGGQAGCASALQALGTSPYTYQHIATKLVTHFVSDTPSLSDVTTVYDALAATGGSLDAAAQALIGLPDAWVPLAKLRTPLDLVIAALRAIGATSATVPTIDPIVSGLGQPTWCPPFPNGWSDFAADWAGPQSVILRMDWLTTLCGSLTGISPASVAASALGAFLSPNTVAAMNGVSSPSGQLTLLFSSPEFQRR